MKLTKSSIHRLQLEKDCGCKAMTEFADQHFTKSLGEGVVTFCEKHEAVKSKDTREMLTEMLLETLTLQAESAGKTAIAQRESTPTSLSGTSGEQVTSMGAPAMPKTREKVNPLKPKTAHFDRPDARRPQNTQYGNLNIAQHDDITDEELNEQGITITGDIGDVPQDPRVDAAIDTGLSELETVFDDEDSREGGVSQKLVDRQAVD